LPECLLMLHLYTTAVAAAALCVTPVQGLATRFPTVIPQYTCTPLLLPPCTRSLAVCLKLHLVSYTSKTLKLS